MAVFEIARSNPALCIMKWYFFVSMLLTVLVIVLLSHDKNVPLFRLTPEYLIKTFTPTFFVGLAMGALVPPKRKFLEQKGNFLFVVIGAILIGLFLEFIVIPNSIFGFFTSLQEILATHVMFLIIGILMIRDLRKNLHIKNKSFNPSKCPMGKIIGIDDEEEKRFVALFKKSLG